MELLDESITLSSAVHLAGYPSVVGTLWQAMDISSSEVAKRVYDWMLGGENEKHFDTSRVAEGPHTAVQVLRESTRNIPGFSKEGTE